jgi:peptide/nickel transport system substrate-binding protein
MLYWQAPTILNTHLAQGDKDLDAGRLILEPLAAFGPDGSPIPYLAAEIPTLQNGGVSPDLKSVTWKLKQGIKWSDGSGFSADDVVFTWQYMSDPKTAASDAFAAEGVASVETRDPFTVAVTYAQPNPNPYQIFVGVRGNILQKKQFQPYLGVAAKDAPGNLQPVGTGPYKIIQFKPGDSAIYTINEHYRELDRPFFKQVQIKGGGDAASAARAVFQTGEADYAWNLQVEAQVMNQIQQGGRAEMVTALSPNVERLALNFADPGAETDGARAEPDTRHPLFSDLNVRKAFAMAVDRKAIAEQLYGPAGAATCNIVTAPATVVSPNAERMDVCQFNLEAANQLLDQSGWVLGPDGVREKNGTRMRVVFQTTVNGLRQRVQDIVKNGWKKIGVDVELKAIDPSAFFSSDPGNPFTAAHFYADVEMFYSGSGDPDQTKYLDHWTTPQIAQRANQWHATNYGRYSNPLFDDLYRQYRTERDETRREQLVIQMNDLLVSDVAVIPLVARTQPTDAKSKQLHGVNPTPWDSALWNIAEWSRDG